MATALKSKAGAVKARVVEWYKATPLYLVIIIGIVAVLVVALIFMAIIKILTPQPKSYETYFETIEQVQDYEALASENSGAYRPIDQQLGREQYEKEVLGIDNETYKPAARHQLDAIIQVEVNNEQTRRLGGISTPAELEQYATNNIRSTAAKQAVDESIALAQGKPVEMQLADALYVPPTAVN
ncbi:hypothetical protein [Psychrobacter sp. AOP31-A1-22]|uniref:hypothetical protein n=1 Tax=Psychrobacter sp. AOP31-A1-22 TaxID=3457696 RepID=UPI004036D8F5